MRTGSLEAMPDSQVKFSKMKNKFVLSLMVVMVFSAGLVVSSVHFQTKRATVSEQFNANSVREKEKTPKNDLMLWESLSSHLLSLN
jgi:cell division protein FtsL